MFLRFKVSLELLGRTSRGRLEEGKSEFIAPEVSQKGGGLTGQTVPLAFAIAGTLAKIATAMHELVRH